MFIFFKNHWERMIFSASGLVFLVLSIFFMIDGSVPEATASFVMTIFSFVFGSLARFKKFRGFGFEAEMWEDKQKEAEDLIEKLRSTLSIYSREAIRTRVMSGRWGGDGGWDAHIRFYNELRTHFNDAGLDIDLSSAHSIIEYLLIFDAVQKQLKSITASINDGFAQARDAITDEFGTPITEPVRYGEKIQILDNAKSDIPFKFNFDDQDNYPEKAQEWAKQQQEVLKNKFGIEIKLDENAIQALEMLSRKFDHRPFDLDETIIDLVK